MTDRSPCTKARELVRLVVEPRPVDDERRIEVCRHLDEGCAVCWTAVLTPRPERLRLSADPLAETLARLGEPRSWAALESLHLEAVRAARTSPLGVVRLAIHEAVLIGEHVEAAPAEEIFAPVLALVGLWRSRRRGEAAPRHRVVEALASLGVTHAHRDDAPSLRRARGRCERTMLGARPLDVDAQAAWRALLAARARRMERPALELRRLQERAELFDLDSRPLAKVGAMADLVGAMAFVPEPAVILMRSVFDLLASRVEAGGDAVLRLHGLMLRAFLAAVLGRVVLETGGEPLPELATTAAALEQAEDAFARHTDAASQRLRLDWIATLTALAAGRLQPDDDPTDGPGPARRRGEPEVS